MTPQEFRARWTHSPLNERAAYQMHFGDLCDLVGHERPSPPSADRFRYERGATRVDGSDGWADVWKRGCFAFEYKGPGRDLAAAYRQLLQYREDLENPPLLVVCDTDRIQIHTNFPNTVKQIHDLRLADLEEPDALAVLRALFHDPGALRPQTTPERVTEAAAGAFAELADRLRERHPDQQGLVAHFVMRLVFCLFAEDIGLLPNKLFSRLVTDARPESFATRCAELFAAMAAGGEAGWQPVPHFNGGLFNDAAVLPLTRADLATLAAAAKLDWGQVEPAIFGTLFERIIDPGRRAQRGAHYTGRDDILRVVEPVLMDPLRAEWAAVQERCEPLLAQLDAAGTAALGASGAALAAARRQGNEARAELDRRAAAFLARLRSVRVLDPACGSGNFLYLALVALKTLEKEVLSYLARHVGTQPLTDQVSPEQLHGIEIEPYAAELAQVTLWIGYLQWTHFNGWPQRSDPILSPHQTIECRDALLEPDGGEAAWPEADVIVGNPPFLGGKKLRAELADAYVDRLFAAYAGRVPREADLCCYWFEKARAAIAAGRAKRAGLLATNSLSGPQMRPVLQRLLDTGGIFMAWRDRPWVLDGAAVRIAMVGFDDGSQTDRTLDGRPVSAVHADLTSGLDLTRARRLKANAGIAFMGDTKGGAFDIDAATAQRLLAAPNPLGRDNAKVVRPWYNGLDVTRRPRDMWIIDFGVDMPEAEAALYEAPFEYLVEHVKPQRASSRTTRGEWWIHERPRPEMRAAIAGLSRYLATPTTSRHRLFAWLDARILPDHKLIVFARDDDYFFGVLHSRAHELWSLRAGARHGVGNDPVYTPTTCFETFPFPDSTPEQRDAVAEAARALDELRTSRLAGDAKLTMTALYNRPPAWLTNAHAALDAAVLAAYGWPADLADEELLARLLALNGERAGAEG